MCTGDSSNKAEPTELPSTSLSGGDGMSSQWWGRVSVRSLSVKPYHRGSEWVPCLENATLFARTRPHL